ncbi:MAG: hypothetical protein J5859_04855 [Clostridia bacterium]|nr:hypothetical protein [Clostridia bacterium]
MKKAILATKVGMTQIFDENGVLTPVTVLTAGPCAGCCDILVAPNIQAGNILGKCLTVSAKAKMAGVIVGAKCPIAMVSRGSTAEEKFISIVMAALVAKGMQRLAE